MKNLTLNKKVNIPEFGIVTKAMFMELAKQNGWTAKIKTTNGYNDGSFKRSYYNRLDGPSQVEYENKMNQPKEKFYLELPDSTSYDISKTEYEYFNSLL